MSITTWNKYHCSLLLGASILFMFSRTLWPILLVSFVSFLWLWVISWPELRIMKPKGGYPNILTGIRYAGLIYFALDYKELSNFQSTVILLFLLLLDGVDGYVARVKDQRSLMGEFFDKETDALYICLVSCILFLKGMSGYTIFIPAFLRYLFVVVTHLINLPEVKEKRQWFGIIVAVTMCTVLTASFILPYNLRFIMITISTIFLLVSFIYSFIHLLNVKKKLVKNPNLVNQTFPK